MPGWRRLPVLVGTVVLAVLLAGCGGPKSGPPPNHETDLNKGANQNQAATQAALMRAKLVAIFADRASLVAYTTHAAVESGMDSAEVRAAVDGLHNNRAHLIHQIDAAQGRRDPKAGIEELGTFKESWEKRTSALLDYIHGTVSHDRALQSTAESHLHGVGRSLALGLEDLTDQVLSREDVHGMLAGHMELTTGAIDSIVAGEPDAPDDVVDMARSSKEIAKNLARGFAVGTYALLGNAIAPGAKLRADLTSLFVEHVSQTVLLSEIVAADGAQSDAAKTAEETLRANVDDLARRLEGIYGSSVADEFTGIFEEHVRQLIGYTEARASGDKPGTAPSDTQYARDLSSFFQKVTDGHVNGQDMKAALSDQESAVEDTVNAVAEGSASAVEKLQLAEVRAEKPAKLLAIGIVEQFPKTYTG
ncbi:MAG: hypothetical protein ACRDMV_13750 [Streptosporangiales bacterium]